MYEHACMDVPSLSLKAVCNTFNDNATEKDFVW